MNISISVSSSLPQDKGIFLMCRQEGKVLISTVVKVVDLQEDSIYFEFFGDEEDCLSNEEASKYLWSEPLTFISKP